MKVLPNLVYIGPDKAASTWFFHLFQCHPDIYVTPAKDLYFFDRYFHKGLDWYSQQFDGSQGEKIVAEISHDYLYSSIAARRMTEVLPEARLMVCLREPCERTFSGYMHLVKSGHFKGSFREALKSHPGLIQRSLYGRWLAEYLAFRPRSQFRIALFDDLKADSQRCANVLLRDLGVAGVELPASLHRSALPAGRSRSVVLTRMIRSAADYARDLGFPGIVGRVKSSAFVQRLLYVSYSKADRPQAPPDVVRELQEVFRDDLAQLDELMGTNVSRLWGYRAAQPTIVPAAKIVPANRSVSRRFLSVALPNSSELVSE